MVLTCLHSSVGAPLGTLILQSPILPSTASEFLKTTLVLCDDNRDGPAWARQRSCIQKLMMHPPSAAKFLDFQMPVARDFADVLGDVVDSDGVVPNLYDKLFQYTMECKHAIFVFLAKPT